MNAISQRQAIDTHTYALAQRQASARAAWQAIQQSRALIARSRADLALLDRIMASRPVAGGGAWSNDPARGEAVVCYSDQVTQKCSIRKGIGKLPVDWPEVGWRVRMPA